MVDKKTKKLNNLHILALFLWQHGPARAHQARQALIQQRFGRVTELNRDWFSQYFSRVGHFSSGCKYAIPGTKQLWEPTGKNSRYENYRGSWRLTTKGVHKAQEALEILRKECGCRLAFGPALARCKSQ